MWIHLALLLLVLLVITDIVYRILIQYGYSSFDLVAYSILGASISGILYALYYRKTLKKPKTSMEGLYLVAIGILFFVGFLLLREAQIRAPNMGLVNAIAYSSVAFTLLALHILFQDPLRWQAILGCLMIIAGIFLGVVEPSSH